MEIELTFNRKVKAIGATLSLSGSERGGPQKLSVLARRGGPARALAITPLNSSLA